MEVKALRTPVFHAGEDLHALLASAIKHLPEKTIVVVTSKIVALAENRVAPATTEAGRERLIKRESQWAIKTKWTWLTIKDNMVMASAGIDESNSEGKIVLLPKDSFASAVRLRQWLMRKFKRRRIGVLITDSRLLPLRAGIVGVALGYSGFSGVRDYRGTPDIFGRILKMSRTDVADSLATAAVLCMGEGAEQQPLAVISGAPVEFTSRVDRNELVMDPREDVYLPLFQQIKKIRLKRMPKSW